MKARRAHPLRFLGWLILIAAVVGAVSLLSYSLAMAQLVRTANPGLGAWWDGHQFYFMEEAATALGLLAGIRIGAGAVAGTERRSRTGIISFILAVIIFVPLIHICPAVARLGWNGNSASVGSWLITREGYAMGRQVDKVVITGIYFLKTAGFAFLAGLALAAIAAVAAIPMGSAARRETTSAGPMVPGPQ